MDLAGTSVFLDFDGTVTLTDTGVHLLERLGRPGWRELEKLYAAGTIGSRECLVRQWAMLPPDEDTLRATAAEVELDPGVVPLVESLRGPGAEVTVVSDGFGFHVEDVCRPLDLPVLTNEVDWATGDLRFPHLDRCCPCSTCGTCKQAPIRDAARRGRTTVFVGDGISDRKAALLVDRLFAKDDLADWCEMGGVEHVRFDRLAEVQQALVP